MALFIHSFIPFLFQAPGP